MDAEKSLSFHLSRPLQELAKKTLRPALRQDVVIGYLNVYKGKWGLAAYLVASLASIDFNAPFRKEKKYLTEYYMLASIIEYDRL
jgi:hypothetical protein